MATVTFEHVNKIYGDFHAVKDLNLEIGDGEFMVLVGPSGCGKTTSLRMIAGLEEISDGTLRIGDRVVNDVPPKDRDIAMVFQSYALYPAHVGPRQPRLRPEAAQGPQGRDRAPGQRGGRDDPAPEAPRPQAEGALRRPAPARRARPRDRPRAGGVPDGRAALQPRRQAARPDPRRDRPAPPAARDDHRLRHPRPGRGDDDGHADRGHERGPPPAGRHPADPLRHPDQPLRRRLHRQPVDELRRRHARRAQAATPRLVGAGDWSIPVPPRYHDAVGRTRAGKLVVGFRPEHLEHRRGRAATSARSRPGPTSSSTSATRSSCTSTPPTRTSWRSSAPSIASARATSSSSSCRSSKLHLFDAETGSSPATDAAAARPLTAPHRREHAGHPARHGDGPGPRPRRSGADLVERVVESRTSSIAAAT